MNLKPAQAQSCGARRIVEQVRKGAARLRPCGFALLLATTALAAETAAITPREPVILYESAAKNDLSSFYTWLAKYGRDKDPDRVFQIVERIDGAPAIRISGQWYGGIVTKENYANYRLVAEWRWGVTTWGDRKNKARDSGVLFHISGEDGNNNKNMHGAWTRSVEFQILEGGTGDIWLVFGYDRDKPEPIQPRLTVPVASQKHKLGFPIYDPKGTPTEFKNMGRIAWGGIDPDWKPDLGFRGKTEAEKPLGEWNRIEMIAKGGDLDYFVNGIKVNEGRNGTFKEGRLLFQSEGAEIFFRRIELHPLP
jgi:hypothetical protein